MSDIIDLGGAPANEDCAQLGHTPDFERLNRLEVAAYRAAMSTAEQKSAMRRRKTRPRCYMPGGVA